MLSLSELAQRLNLKYRGNGDIGLQSVGSLADANGEQISFLANPKYTAMLQTTAAGAVILTEQMAEQYQGNVLLAKDSYVTFAKVAQLFQQHKEQSKPFIHPQSYIDATAKLGKNISIGAFSVIEEGVEIADGCRIANHVCIGKNVKLGANCQIDSAVTIEADCRLGNRNRIYSGAVIGADGFGLARDTEAWVKIPQTGAVVIGDDCSVGANTTVDRGAIGDTTLGNDVHLDNQIQIGHNVKIGNHTVIAGCTAVAGSATIGQNCLIGGAAGIVGHIEICDGVTVQAMTLVTHDIKQAGNYSSAAPLQSTKEWRKNAVRFRQLDKMARRLSHMEKQIK